MNIAAGSYLHRLCELPNQPWKEPRVPEELYDLRNDSNEQTNLISDKRYQTELDEMRALLRSHLDATGDPFLDKPFTRDYNPDMYQPHTPGEKYD
ncbi:MAG: hypothetical protein GY866_13280 [Proteobacteria bacterium]|nr:hypothetical protein [Pseudomonadota bacterium]